MDLHYQDRVSKKYELKKHVNELTLILTNFFIPDSKFSDFGRLPESFLDVSLGMEGSMNGVPHPLQNLSLDESYHPHHSETQPRSHRRIIREIIV